MNKANVLESYDMPTKKTFKTFQVIAWINEWMNEYTKIVKTLKIYRNLYLQKLSMVKKRKLFKVEKF